MNESNSPLLESGAVTIRHRRDGKAAESVNADSVNVTPSAELPVLVRLPNLQLESAVSDSLSTMPEPDKSTAKTKLSADAATKRHGGRDSDRRRQRRGKPASRFTRGWQSIAYQVGGTAAVVAAVVVVVLALVRRDNDDASQTGWADNSVAVNESAPTGVLVEQGTRMDVAEEAVPSLVTETGSDQAPISLDQLDLPSETVPPSSPELPQTQLAANLPSDLREPTADLSREPLTDETLDQTPLAAEQRYANPPIRPPAMPTGQAAAGQGSWTGPDAWLHEQGSRLAPAIADRAYQYEAPPSEPRDQDRQDWQNPPERQRLLERPDERPAWQRGETGYPPAEPQYPSTGLPPVDSMEGPHGRVTGVREVASPRTAVRGPADRASLPYSQSDARRAPARLRENYTPNPTQSYERY